MEHKFKIGLYDTDPFELVTENFREEMEQIHGGWWPEDDEIYTRASHEGETRFALRQYPDDLDNQEERDTFLKDMNHKNDYFYDTIDDLKFSGFYLADNYFGSSQQALDYNIRNVYELNNGRLNGLYFSFAVIDFDQIYERFCEDLWDAAEDVFEKKKLDKYFDKFDKDSKVYKEFVNTLQFLKPNLDLYKNDFGDCKLIDKVAFQLLKSKISFFVSKQNYNNLSLDEIIYKKSEPIYFLFETGFFLNNTKSGAFDRFTIEDNSQKIVTKQYENDVLKKELAEEYKINKYPHVYQSDF